MQVEIMGGPRDGEVMTVRDGTHHIRFPIQTTGGMAVKTLPIIRRVDGKFIIRWKKGI